MEASWDSDTMTIDKAMYQPDREEFIKVIHKELEYHIKRKHLKRIPFKSIPKGWLPITMLWCMKRNRNTIG